MAGGPGIKDVKLDLTAPQAVALVALESAQNAIASSLSQLENFGLQAECNILRVAFKQVLGDKQALVASWQRLVVAPPAAPILIASKA